MSRALRALSSAYVERRAAIAEGAPLSGRGKRAAFALFYGPLHFLLLEHIVSRLDSAKQIRTLIDIGCGTGAAGAAWASVCAEPPAVTAVDRNAWALGEAATTYRHFGIRVRTRHEDAVRSRLPNEPAAVLAAFAMNELADADRDALLDRLLARLDRPGNHVLIVEPLAGFVAPWWRRWRARFEARGGRGDEWRARAELPPLVAKLDRAAGLDHRELTGRSLFASSATPAVDRAASS